MSAESLTVMLTVLGIFQILTGALTWYVNVQIRILRLELVSREKCDKHRESVNNSLSGLVADLSVLKARNKE